MPHPIRIPSARTDRREFVTRTATALLAAAAVPRGALADAPSPRPSVPIKSVACILTAYQKGLHADVLAGKILEGWKQDGGPGPALRLASMYVDQFPDGDMARSMSKRFDVPIFPTIEQALTLGRSRIAVDGVISIGEHGDYPWNEKQQHLYPRRRFFEGIAAAFEKHGTVVPVFNDKHLGPEWEDASWMYRRARALNIPFMAGSSMTVGFREPDLTLPRGSELEAVVGIGYSGLDIYGSHALELLQCLVERRRDAERGVAWVECLRGQALWRLFDSGEVRRDLLDAALAITPHSADGDVRGCADATLFRFRYLDGLPAAVVMLPGFAQGTAVAMKIRGRAQPLAVRFDERTQPRHPHFAYLLKAIERMIHTGRPQYPVERTLLTTGILDRALTSLHEGQRRRETPELAIAYTPVDYPNAPLPALDSDPRG
ncbi:MAG: hypothetical protein JNL97_14730 [Verrucomicrobiales bacterium]|nr:hypothetical protein [Verrucomicrobiales bacterium]